MTASDPYATLGVSPAASDAELRAAYRRLVQLHHPDHNGGSRESALRFEAVQAAYAQVRALRATGASHTTRATGAAHATRGTQPPPYATADPGLDSRLADMEEELRAAQAARDKARQAVREAAAQAEPRPRATDEELGYIKTDDSFSKILADAASELSEHLSEAREHGVPKRLSDLIDELGSKLTGDPPEH
jgi:curved DNA-binding protein CbpA